MGRPASAGRGGDWRPWTPIFPDFTPLSRLLRLDLGHFNFLPNLLSGHLDRKSLFEIFQLALLALAGDLGTSRDSVRVLVLAVLVGHGQLSSGCRDDESLVGPGLVVGQDRSAGQYGD